VYTYFLGQQDELLLESQGSVFVVSLVADDPGGQHDSFAEAVTGRCVSLKATMPIAAITMIAKRKILIRLFFLGGQQLPSHPQSLWFP
jgi:hypothetical protein